MSATATAEAQSAVKIRKPSSRFSFEDLPVDAHAQEVLPVDSQAGEPWEQLLWEASPKPLVGPIPVRAAWLPTIERRIADSIASPEVDEIPDDGRWIDSNVAAQAFGFFDATSDVLPSSEPYIYTSTHGDLVAEFEATHGKITTIVGKTSVVSFAATDATMHRTTLELPVSNIREVRKQLKELTDRVSGENGTVDPF